MQSTFFNKLTIVLKIKQFYILKNIQQRKINNFLKFKCRYLCIVYL